MTKSQLIIAGLLGVVTSFVVFAGSMLLTTGLLLGCLTLAGFTVIYQRFPILKKCAMRFPGLFDVGACLATYCIFGPTIIGLISAAVVGLGTSFLLDFQVQGYRLAKEEMRQRMAEGLEGCLGG